MILIADSGSTKTQWVLADHAGVVKEFFTPGINPVHLTDDALRHAFDEALSSVECGPARVRFYGAGCTEWLCGKVEAILGAVTRCGDVKVGSDMLGAAHALCGNEPGIVAILGTGSNSCYYNGNHIEANTPPLGYILGDEGSGARLGIRLVNGVLKGYLSAEVANDFFSETGLDKAAIINRVYRGEAANVFLASLVPFIKAHISDASVKAMVEDEFRLFLERNIVKAYPTGLPVNFAGSVSAVFENQLRAACDIAGVSVGGISPRPMPGLVKYHLNRFTS